jgi:hypothetical protein
MLFLRCTACLPSPEAAHCAVPAQARTASALTPGTTLSAALLALAELKAGKSAHVLCPVNGGIHLYVATTKGQLQL